MSIRKSVYAAVIASLASLGSASAFAEGPSAHKIDLGAINGVAYYTEEAGSFRVVATLAQEVGQPIRVEMVLAPGQTMVLSTASEGDIAPTRVELSREANDLMVHPVAATN